MIHVYSKYDTARLRYVLDFVFRQKGCEYKLITDLENWYYEDDYYLNYSSEIIECDYSFEPSGFLNESDIDPDLKLEKDDEGELLIRETDDPLSAIFYCLSRYEEYQPHEKDEHGRYPAKASSLYQLDLLRTPIIDQIVKRIWHKLGLDYEEVLDNFECVPSFDIDVAWAYKNRPVWRRAGGFLKGRLFERVQVLTGLKKDPYDTYSKINAIAAKVDRVICFVPLSDWGPKDKNIHWKNENYRSLIRGLNSTGGIGLHPGYNSHLNAEILETEKKRLEEIVGHEMVKSRFHFLRFSLPESYQFLLEAGFEKDYSMGYAEEIGFRAGTSIPFYFYDLTAEQKTDLLIFPFAYMDSALKDRLNLQPPKAIEEIHQMMAEVKSVGGLFMCIWHNHSINDKGEWEGWYDVLEKTVEWKES